MSKSVGVKVYAREKMNRNRTSCILEDSMCTITGDCASILVEGIKKQPGRHCGMMADGKMVEVIFLEDCSFE